MFWNICLLLSLLCISYPLIVRLFLISKNFLLLFFSFCYNTAYNSTNSNKNLYFFLLFSLSLTLYNSNNNNIKKFVPSFTFIIRPFWYLKFFFILFFLSLYFIAINPANSNKNRYFFLLFPSFHFYTLNTLQNGDSYTFFI